MLLTAWPLLRDTWLAETHADRIIRTKLHNAAADWAHRSRDPSYLYSGSLLEDAAATATRISADPVRYPPLTQTERDFIRASERARHRMTRSRQGIIAFLMVLVVGFASAAFLAARANQETARERDAAISGQLITQSEALGETNPILARRESLAAWQIDRANPAARYAMLTAARLAGTGVLTSDGASVDAVAHSPDGKILATGNSHGILRLWDIATQRQIGVPLGTPSRAKEIDAVAFSPDGKTVATAGQGGIVRLWDVTTHQLIGKLLAGDVSAIYSIAFSPHEDLLAVGHFDGTVQLWNVASGRQTGASIHAGEVDTLTAGTGGQRADVLIAAAPSRAWQRLSAGAGAHGPRESGWARVPVRPGWRPGRGHWLLARRSISDPAEIACYACYGPAGPAPPTWPGSPGAAGISKSVSSRLRARPGWITTRSAPGGPGTPTSPCPCSPWPGSRPAGPPR